MTHPHTLALPVLAALLLGGCSFTGGGGGGGGGGSDRDIYDALESGMSAYAVRANQNSLATTTGTVTMDRNGDDLRVAIDGRVYDMQGTWQTSVTNPHWVNQVRYDVYQFESGADGAEVIAGEYMAVAGMLDQSRTNIYIMHGGVQTPTSGLPNQSAVYEGAWEIAHIGGGDNDVGIYQANANFDARTIAFTIRNEDAVYAGNGYGSISGSTFDSTFDLNEGVFDKDSNNNVTGNFYGPNAEEMAGIIVGDEAAAGSQPTYGVLYGHQR
ncbi:transferrin-binding protein-like solute binding protein [Pelagibacterium xiamenense]|uniref:transferrin-binding protein-like solute binding protein n=1 Tax=Pelagibacterium xiamenense TaxID=2901140 RepID=UPI001E443D2F|nr:transferrin-binding protein-like solute binding protein [Pelagibacterium xiamenense]MCD7059781.1 transferrin-binding protein-like solute binding protein [Pelagibacterium xiamenense]